MFENRKFIASFHLAQHTTKKIPKNNYNSKNKQKKYISYDYSL